MKRESLGTLMFIAVAVLSFIAAFTPLLGGRPMNVTFFAVGVVWLIIAAAVARKIRKQSGRNGDHVN